MQWVTVCSERSSCPCFAAALSGSPTESVRSWRSISFRRLMKDSRFGMKKAGARDIIGSTKKNYDN